MLVSRSQESGHHPLQQQHVANRRHVLDEEDVQAHENGTFRPHIAEVAKDKLAHHNGQLGARPAADQETLDKEHEAEVRVDHRRLQHHPEVEETETNGGGMDPHEQGI